MPNRGFGAETREGEISPARRGQVLVEAPVRLEFHDVDDREGPEAARNGVVREGRSGEDLRGGRGGRIRQVLPLGDRAEAAESFELGDGARGDGTVERVLLVQGAIGAGGGGESERVDEDPAVDAEQLLAVRSSNVGRFAQDVPGEFQVRHFVL